MRYVDGKTISIGRALNAKSSVFAAQGREESAAGPREGVGARTPRCTRGRFDRHLRLFIDDGVDANYAKPIKRDFLRPCDHLPRLEKSFRNRKWCDTSIVRFFFTPRIIASPDGGENENAPTYPESSSCSTSLKQKSAQSMFSLRRAFPNAHEENLSPSCRPASTWSPAKGSGTEIETFGRSKMAWWCSIARTMKRFSSWNSSLVGGAISLVAGKNKSLRSSI